MEKRSLTLRDYIFIVAGVVVIVCMFLNWFPVDLDLGIAQFDDVLGKINAFTFANAIKELEENLGAWASALPEAYDQLKTLSTVLVAFAVVTIIIYVSAIVMHILRKDKYLNLLSAVASVCAIATSYMFYSIISGVYDYLDITALGYSAINTVMNSPCGIVMLAGLVSVACTDPVAEAIVSIVQGFISSIVKIVRYIGEWAKLIVNNIGYVVSDVAGAIAGIFVGSWLLNVTDSVLLAVIGGLAVAGVVAIVGVVFVFRVILQNKESIFK